VTRASGKLALALFIASACSNARGAWLWLLVVAMPRGQLAAAAALAIECQDTYKATERAVGSRACGVGSWNLVYYTRQLSYCGSHTTWVVLELWGCARALGLCLPIVVRTVWLFTCCWLCDGVWQGFAGQHAYVAQQHAIPEVAVPNY
jgi:hypothetical protein